MGTTKDAGSSGLTRAPFPERTDWHAILIAGGPSSSPGARETLNHLCQIYWPPLYAFARFKGNNREAAQDLTQSFFRHLLERDFIQKLDPKKGKFRNFLLGAFTKFMIDEWRREIAKKRGGQAEVVVIDEQEAELNYGHLPKSDPSPEALYDRAWAQTVVRAVLKRLEQEYAQNAELHMYEAFQSYLAAEPKEIIYSELVKRLNKDKGALQVAWHRFRRRFGELLRTEISLTVEKAEDVDDEIRYLLSAWAVSAPTTK